MMKALQPYNSKDLLAMLVALLELQLFAVQAKRKCPASAAMQYLKSAPDLSRGIYTLIHRTPSVWLHGGIPPMLLDTLFLGCPSNTLQYTMFPVRSPFPEQTAVDMYGSSPFVMWGYHPYADNRRQFITEMIQQLQDVLNARGYNL